MSESGRYYYKDEASGRLFMIEPQHSRSEKATDVVFKNGHGGSKGITEGVKGKPSQGGSIPDDGSESLITEAMNPVVIGPYMSPESYINFCIKNNLKLDDVSAVEYFSKDGNVTLPNSK